MSNRVKKVKYLRIGPVDLGSMGLIVLRAGGKERLF